MSMELSLRDPLVRRLLAWLNQRFAPANGLLFLVLYATAVLSGRFLSSKGPLSVGWTDGVGFVAAWCFFLMLRIFDEHKDYALDCQLHPERVLQRGLITLGHLKVLAALAITLQLVISVWTDRGFGKVTLLWLGVMGWSCLMAKEFFVGTWLRKHVMLYAISHMVVTPMAVVWLAHMGASAQWLPIEVLWVALLSLLSGATFELTRKTWGPEEERPGLDSYSQILGITKSPVVILGLVLAAAAVQLCLLGSVFAAKEVVFSLLVGANVILPAWSLHRFRAAPSAAGRKRNEATVGVSMLASYVILIAALVTEHGVRWP